MGELAMDDLAEVAEQAALFAMAIDHDKVNPDKTNGHQGVATIVAEHAVKFWQYYQDIALKHWNGDSGLMWDSYDWYKTSDIWFDEKIAREIYI
ncbi:MAG: hypothetical protein DRI24_18215 [Deltaproteobacteria bacterium]|nr:MAG: hypothetical protein DRI24_18215 [Deltaproteobacteria bacterium]